MATHPSILTWRIPWREKPGRLQSVRSKSVGHKATMYTHVHIIIDSMLSAVMH